MGKGGRAAADAKAVRVATVGAEAGAITAVEAAEAAAGINSREAYCQIREKAAPQARPFSSPCGPILVSPMLIDDLPREFPRSRQLLAQLPHAGTQFGAVAEGGAGDCSASVRGCNQHVQALQQDHRSFQP